MKPRILKSMPPRVSRQREGMSAAHLANVRLLPCVVCGGAYWAEGRPHNDPHHLMRLLPGDSGKRAMSLRSADRWTVPICRLHHDQVTIAVDDEWFAERGIDARAVAAALWSERDDLDAMRRVIDRAHSMARLKLSQTSIPKGH